MIKFLIIKINDEFAGKRNDQMVYQVIYSFREANWVFKMNQDLEWCIFQAHAKWQVFEFDIASDPQSACGKLLICLI